MKLKILSLLAAVFFCGVASANCQFEKNQRDYWLDVTIALYSSPNVPESARLYASGRYIFYRGAYRECAQQ